MVEEINKLSRRVLEVSSRTGYIQMVRGNRHGIYDHFLLGTSGAYLDSPELFEKAVDLSTKVQVALLGSLVGSSWEDSQEDI